MADTGCSGRKLQGCRSTCHSNAVLAADVGGKPLFEFRQSFAEGARYFAPAKNFQNGLNLFLAEVRFVNRNFTWC